MNETVSDFNFCTESLKAFQVQINGTSTNRASAGQRNFRLSEPCKQRPHYQERRSHFSYKIIRCGNFVYLHGINKKFFVLRLVSNFNAESSQNLAYRSYVVQVRHFVKAGFPVLPEKGRGNNRKDGIFCAAYFYRARQPSAAAYDKSFQIHSSPVKGQILSTFIIA